MKFKDQISTIAILVGGLLLSLTIYFISEKEFKKEIDKKLLHELNSKEEKSKLLVHEKILSLKRMADRWNSNGGYKKSVWTKDALNYVKDFKGIHAIEWADSTYHVRWIVPLKGNEKALNLNLAFEEKRRIALLKSKNEKKYVISKAVELVQGGRGVLVYFPLFIKNNFDGFILVIIKIKDLLESTKFKNDNFAIKYLLQGETNTYENYFIKNTYNIFGDTYQALIKPNKKWLEKENKNNLSYYYFIFSLLISFFITYIKYSQKRAILLKKNIEALSRQKSSFLANMSHEIRTPMNGILGFSEILLESNLKEDDQHSVQMIRNSVESLLTIVNDILDFSKLENGKVVLENLPFSLNNLLSEMTEISKQVPMVSDKNLDIVPHLPEKECYVIGDHHRLRQVILNLISNSIKFTKSGYINVKLTTKTDSNNFVDIKIDIEDTGIGIPKNKLENIFYKFTQSDVSDTRIHGGTGLGLSISRELIELMGGKLTVESNEGIGSIFTISLKLPRTDQITEPPRSNKNIVENFTGNILVVEDNIINQKLILKSLTKLGLNVEITKDGLLSLEKVKLKKYDLIFMDLQMPVMDGFQATQKIREFDTKTPIVALSANAIGDISKKCKDVGMNDYLSKPLKRKFLILILNKYLIESNQ